MMPRGWVVGWWEPPAGSTVMLRAAVWPSGRFEFRPTLERQRDDAAAKGQVAREQIFDGLLSRLDGEAS